MASQAAQNYFNSFPAEEQARIQASWGGQDLMDAWFNAARAAGAVQAGGERNAGEATTADAQKSGGWTPQTIREYFQSKGYDTFDEVDDNTINTWINQGLWDPNRKVFKPERQGVGEIDYSRQPDFKPQDCPEGQTPVGSGANAKCAPNTDFNPQTGSYQPGGGTGAAAQAPEGEGESTTGADWLQEYLTNLMNTRGGVFGSNQKELGTSGDYVAHPLQGGGVMWSQGDQNGAPRMAGVDPIPQMDGAYAAGVKPGVAEMPQSGSGAGVQMGGSQSAAGGGAVSVNPGLVAATLNAFSPNAPSQTGTAQPEYRQAVKNPGATQPAPTPPMPGVPQPLKAQQPLTGQGALTGAVAQKKQWWQAA